MQRGRQEHDAPKLLLCSRREQGQASSVAMAYEIRRCDEFPMAPPRERVGSLLAVPVLPDWLPRPKTEVAGPFERLVASIQVREELFFDAQIAVELALGAPPPPPASPRSVHHCRIRERIPFASGMFHLD